MQNQSNALNEQETILQTAINLRLLDIIGAGWIAHDEPTKEFMLNQKEIIFKFETGYLAVRSKGYECIRVTFSTELQIEDSFEELGEPCIASLSNAFLPTADSEPRVEKIEAFYVLLPSGDRCLDAIRFFFEFDRELFVENHPVDGLHISSTNNLIVWKEWQEETDQAYEVTTIMPSAVPQKNYER